MEKVTLSLIIAVRDPFFTITFAVAEVFSATASSENALGMNAAMPSISNACGMYFVFIFLFW
jgi:hypothetical protein